MKTIVLPVDFSEKAERLVEQVVRFARDVDARIDLLHIASSDVGFAIGDMGFQYFPKIEEAQMTEELNKLQALQELIKKENVPCDISLQQGEPGSIILEFAAEKNADYIAIGSHGRSGMYDLFIGSLTKAITRRSKIPVLVIPLKN